VGRADEWEGREAPGRTAWTVVFVLTLARTLTLPAGALRAEEDFAQQALEWVQRGQDLLRVQHPVEACECFGHAALLLPTWWIPHFERASCGRLIGDPYDVLVRHAQQAVEQSPASGVAWELLGFIHEDAGFADRARPAYQRAAKLDPRLRGARLRLGFLELGAGRPATAQAHFAAVRADWPTSAQALSGLAAAAAQAGDPALAEDALLALALRSNYPASVYARLVALYRSVSDEAGARLAERAWRQAAANGGVLPPLQARLHRR
jgi:tetratricopeptide (TPR) repeat protein